MILGGLDSNPVFTDSIIGLEAVDEDLPKGGSEENQNTLFLDSQSMIIEGDAPAKDHNLSQQMMHSLEASSILQHRDCYQQTHGAYFSVGGNTQPNVMPSNAPSSNHNTDVLTYSLTNTITTIESLHDELTAIRNGLELSQKRGTNLIRSIHQYAREIDANEEYEELKSGNEADEPVDFIKGIKGYYSRIQDEIEQLKTILIESGSVVP